MTANPPPVKVERMPPPVAHEPPPRPEDLSELEKVIFPRWMDHDHATGGPNYMAMVMWLITIELFAMLAVLALFAAS